MSSYLYHCVDPANEPSSGTFTEFSTSDFVLNFPNRKILAGTIRISANVLADDGVSTREVSRLQVDPLVGAHAFFDTITTSLDKLGQIESVSDYGRYIKTIEQAKVSPSDMFKGSAVAELKAPNANWQSTVLKGLNSSRKNLTPDNYTTNPVITDNASFSILPQICLNTAIGGDGTMSYRKTGSIRLTLRIARANSCLYGAGASEGEDATGPSISLANLRVHFVSVPDDGVDTPLTMSNTVSIRSSVQSTFANISCQVPAICRGVSATLISTANLTAGGLNNPLACENVAGLSQLQFIYNSTINNSLVSYTIDDYPEMLERYVRSVSDSDHATVGMWNVKQNDGFGIGLSFDSLVDLRTQRFQVQLSSTVNSNNPMSMFLFFHGIQVL